MSVKINGAIFRNIPEEAEGIDTPSLLVNGKPLSGGTQLYKHSIEVELSDSENTYDSLIEVITWIPNSFTGKGYNYLVGKYLSGTVYHEYLSDSVIVAITNEQDEVKVICYDPHGNLTELTPAWSGTLAGKLGTDTIVAL